ncbi:ABC transporter-like protein [Plautia stali symbiont]|nr:ABC transporter-like protein [Plautia stali symbiont]
MLSLRSVNQFYGQNHILWDVDLDLPPGTCTGVLGSPGMGIGYVPQGRHIFSQMRVEDNLLIALMAAQDDRSRAIPQMVLDLFPALYSLRHQRSGELPMDQQQLALARALVLQPKRLILDEPTEGMSPWLEEEMGNLIRRLNRDYGLTILLLEQHVSFFRRVADYFLLLHRGRNVAQGSVAQLDDVTVSKWLTAT